LYLNIYAPLTATPSSNLEVLVFIYGGGLVSGSSDIYEGSYMAGNDIIVVTVNYRLGPLGFLYQSDLYAANENHTGGYFGIQDQRLALEWVQQNIAAFGGNPKEVTISGESAGAISVCMHIAARLSQGLFSKAIMQSGFCEVYNQSNAAKTGDAITHNLGCSGTSDQIIDCLHAQTPAQLDNASLTFTFRPVLNPLEMTIPPLQIIANKDFNPVPLFQGSNLNETSLFMCPLYAEMTELEYYEYIANNYGQAYFELATMYPPTEYPTPVSALVALTSDHGFRCPMRTMFDVYPTTMSSYMYQFSRTPAFITNSCYGAAHSYELFFLYWLGNLTPEEQVLSENMRHAWVSFVQTGIPSFPSGIGPHFPKWDSTNSYTDFDLTLSTGTNFRRDYCDLWDKINGITTQTRVM
jgi:para-nitrobenzyl esterase